MENEHTLIWIISIVAVVGIVAMVIAATRVGGAYAPVSTISGIDSSVNAAGQAVAGNVLSCGSVGVCPLACNGRCNVYIGTSTGTVLCCTTNK